MPAGRVFNYNYSIIILYKYETMLSPLTKNGSYPPPPACLRCPTTFYCYQKLFSSPLLPLQQFPLLCVCVCVGGGGEYGPSSYARPNAFVIFRQLQHIHAAAIYYRHHQQLSQFEILCCTYTISWLDNIIITTR